MEKLILFFDHITKEDVPLVGGKCANLGEMTTKAGVPVPYGFAVTAPAYRQFIKENNLQKSINDVMKRIKNPNDTKVLQEVGEEVRSLILDAPMPENLEKEITKAYNELAKRVKQRNPFVAVRSSATAEDLPGASFAGQQETYLNITGADKVVKKVKECYASLYTDRAIFYRIQKKFKHERVALSAAVQLMIDSKVSGVMFSIDVRNGDPNTVAIEGSWGLGEYIVQGTVTPDDYFIDKKTLKITERKISHKHIMLKRLPKGGTVEVPVPEKMQNEPVISDDQVKQLAKYAIKLEEHYSFPQDIEWALDAKLNKLFILQTRPETAWSEKTLKVAEVIKKGKEILRGLPASPGIGSGQAVIVHDLKDLAKVKKGNVLVTKMTTPDMVPAMKKASAIITDEGGITSHAAIVSRELGIPCIVGTEKATAIIKEGMKISIQGSTGKAYEGIIKIQKKEMPHEEWPVPQTKTKVYVNLAIPEKAAEVAKLPVDGVGLMREEFILAGHVGEHPLSLLAKKEEKKLINKLVEGISTVAKAFSPRPVILRLSDFKTNEYKDLKGGAKYEPHEENPMIGWRGCSRYISPKYEKAFRLELKAVKRIRKKYKNVHIMLPFVRTTQELEQVIKILESEGLKRGKGGMKLWLMAEIPSNIFLAEDFCNYCDGFSIGSNDLTQLILGVDRDSEILGKMGYFNERDPAVKKAIAYLIDIAHENGKTVSICGQAPSTYPDFTEFLVKQGIDSVSVNPDAIVKTKRIVAGAERRE